MKEIQPRDVREKSTLILADTLPDADVTRGKYIGFRLASDDPMGGNASVGFAELRPANELEVAAFENDGHKILY